MEGKACVVGAGPNGLAAAIVLAQSGMQVEVFEAEPQAGGAARTLELTLPGFWHDFGSAVHPMAVGSPFLSSLPLQEHGLQWIHSPSTLAHPFDDGTAVTLERDLRQTELVLGQDGKAWCKLMEPFAANWDRFAPEVLRPVHLVTHTPWLLARIGLISLSSATITANRLFRNARTKALFAGLAAHSFLALDEPVSASVGVMLGAAAHAVGWPIPRGGAQSITTALCDYLASLGATVTASQRVDDLALLEGYDLILCDVTPRQLLRMAGDRLSAGYRRKLEKYRYGPGVFKVDYALSAPAPWKAKDCLRAATVHVGGTLAEIAVSEDAMRHGKVAERPFVLVAQPSLFDSTRAPQGKHILWAYCHVPHASNCNMLERLEAQIERFAPGFRDCILARKIFSPPDLERMDANLIGGDIAGGASDLRQFLFRPTFRFYATSARDLYICSSSTPPGAGVHGMCGYNAAQLALKRFRR